MASLQRLVKKGRPFSPSPRRQGFWPALPFSGQNPSHYSTDAHRDYVRQNSPRNITKGYLFHENIFNDMDLCGVLPLAYTFSVLTTGFVKRSCTWDAMHFLVEMESRSIVPNVKSNSEPLPDFDTIANMIATPYNINNRQTTKKTKENNPINVPKLVPIGWPNTSRLREKRVNGHNTSHWVANGQRIETPWSQIAAFHSSSHRSTRMSDDKAVEGSMAAEKSALMSILDQVKKIPRLFVGRRKTSDAAFDDGKIPDQEEEEQEVKPSLMTKILLALLLSWIAYNIFPLMGGSLTWQSVSLVKKNDPFLKRSGASRLCLLAKDDERIVEIVELGAIAHLANMLQSAPDEKTQLAAIKALDCLFPSDMAVEAFNGSGAEELVRSLAASANDSNIQQYSSKVLQRLDGWKDVREVNAIPIAD